MSPQPPRPEPHITLTVKSTAGVWTDARFNRNNRAQNILDDAIEHFRLDPNPARPYVLRREADNSALALDQKINALGLQDSDVVLIQATQAIDG
jgi:hypothetical protein